MQVEKKSLELEEVKRKNLVVEDKMEEQKKILVMKLEELRMQHGIEEGKLEHQIRLGSLFKDSLSFRFKLKGQSQRNNPLIGFSKLSGYISL